MSLEVPTLDTDRLRVRPFNDADGEDLYALQSNARVLRYWDSPPWTDRSRIESFLAGCRQISEEGSGVRVAVDRRSDGRFIGWCTFNSWNPDFRSASLGCCYVEAA